MIKYVLYPFEKIILYIRGSREKSSQTKSVFWGWLRHSYLHQLLAIKAGFQLKSKFFTDNYSQNVSDLNKAELVWFIYQKQ